MMQGARTFSASSTYKNKKGKVVSSSYVQPTKTKKVYNNKAYKKAQDIKKYVSFASKYIPSKWSWVASKLFGIDTSQYAVWFNNGYQKLEENATYHIKDAYYKEGNMYWIGYCASKMEVAGTIISYYRDSSKTPHQKSYDYTRSFTSKSYNKSNKALINLAEKHYNTGFVDEDISYSTVYKIN